MLVIRVMGEANSRSPTPPMQKNTPGSSKGSSKSSEDTGLWMKGAGKSRKETEGETLIDEQIGDPTPTISVIPATPGSSKLSTKTSSSSTIKASKVNASRKVEEE